MVLLDRTLCVPYPISAMLKRNGRSFRLGPAGLLATILVLVLQLCLVAGTMSSQDSCQDLGSPPGLCSKAVSHAKHLLAVPAPLNTSRAEVGVSEILSLYSRPSTPSLGFLSTADGRAPPLS